MEDELMAVLKQKFKLSQFRPGQLEAIRLLTQHFAVDVFCIFPTSAGKSLIYQLPTIVNNKVTLVLTPLLALIGDQINKLRQLNFTAYSLSSDSLDSRELIYQKLREDPSSINFIFLTPELLIAESFQRFIPLLSNVVGLIAVDECHVILEWGRSFRKAYASVDKLKTLFPGVSILALTATATYHTIKEISAQLQLKDCNYFVQSFNRRNIHYSVFHIGVAQKMSYMTELIRNFWDRKQANDSIIIYAQRRQETEAIANILSQQGVEAFHYHAGLADDVKKRLLHQWTNNEIKIVIATIAFAMGIDKPGVGLILHFSIPASVESYYQESGRAGRDGNQAFSVVFCDKEDVNFRTGTMGSQNNYERFSYYSMLNIFFGQTECRRKFILRYFNSGVKSKKQSFCCDVCDKSKQTAVFSAIACQDYTDYEQLHVGIQAQVDNYKNLVEREPIITLCNSDINEDLDLDQQDIDSQIKSNEVQLNFDKFNQVIQLMIEKSLGFIPEKELKINLREKVLQIIKNKAKTQDQVDEAIDKIVAFIKKTKAAIGILQLQVPLVKMFG